jgi:hypothetical protein
MKNLIQIVSSLCLGLSFILFVSPIFLYWFIHGDYDRYIWIINGPFPFSHLGGGPFQLWTFIGLLFLGLIFVGLFLFLKIIGRRFD